MWTSTASTGMLLYPSAVLQAVGQPNLEQVSSRNAKDAICTGKRMPVMHAFLLPHPPLQDGTFSSPTCLGEAYIALVSPNRHGQQDKLVKTAADTLKTRAHNRDKRTCSSIRADTGQRSATPAVSWKKSAIICTPGEPRQKGHVSCILTPI